MRSGLRAGISLFALASAARLAYLFVASPPFQDFYWDLAGDLLKHGSLSVDGVKTTEFEPMYPLFLALARWMARDHVTAVQVVQALVASLGAVFLFRLAEALTGRRRVGVVCGVLYACYPLLVRHSADAVEAALLTTLLIAFAYSFVVAETPLGASVAGIWLGAAVLTRAAVIPLLPLGVVVMVADGRRRAAIGLTLAAVIMAPYAFRNHALNGSLLPTRGGRNLFIANCEYVVLPEYGPDILGGFAQAILAREGLDLPPSPDLERKQDALFRRYARAEMTRRPLDTLWLKIQNVWYFFSPVLVPYHEPTPETRIVLGEHGAFSVENSPPRSLFNRWSYSVPYAFVVVFGAVGLRSRRREIGRDAILWCIALSFVTVHALYFPSARYRVPMEFVLLFYAAAGLDLTAGALQRQWALRRDRHRLARESPSENRGAVFVGVSEQLLRAGHFVRFRARGHSMSPTIQDGDLLTIGPADPAGVQPGDIILFHQAERPIVHRVVAVRATRDGGTEVLARGDAKNADDAPIEPRQILGKVLTIEARTTSRARGWFARFESLRTLGSRWAFGAALRRLRRNQRS